MSSLWTSGAALSLAKKAPHSANGCDLLAEGHRKFLLNLADVNYIDSTGLAHLVGALVSVRKLNGEIKLLNLSNRFHDVLQITKLHTVVESFDNEATAVESFVHSVAASSQG